MEFVDSELQFGSEEHVANSRWLGNKRSFVSWVCSDRKR